MQNPISALLRGAIDYAGTFPPAALPLESALSVYAGARKGPHAAMLGRFVLPASTLDRFATLIPGFATPQDPRWQVSVLVDDQSDLAQVWAFRSAQADRVIVRSLEFAPEALHDVERLAAVVSSGNPAIEMYFECRLDAALAATLATIARSGACAKVRTGGTTPEAFPAAPDLVRFMRACADSGVPFKATAGLHHALSGRYPLTYEADSDVGSMYGFLNVSLCAALVHTGAQEADAIDVLREDSPRAFTCADEAIEWRGHSVATRDLEGMRRSLFRSFGSCAFSEPVDDVERLHLLQPLHLR